MLLEETIDKNGVLKISPSPKAMIGASPEPPPKFTPSIVTSLREVIDTAPAV